MTTPARRGASPPPGDGFSLVEAVVAIGVFAVVAVGMAGFMASGLRGVMLGRQRAAAVADANEVLETARALAFGDVGLVSSDPTLATDPAISGTCPSSCTFGGERILFAQNPSGHPFNPHVQTGISRPPSTLQRRIYVTGIDSDGDGIFDLRRVTVIVSWERAAVAGVSSSVTATTVISANSPGTYGNPGSAAVVPPLFGTTVAKAGDATLEAEVGTGADLDTAALPTTVLRLFGVNGKGRNRLNAVSDLTCSQQVQTLQSSLGSTPGTSASVSANSVTNPTPPPSSTTQNHVTTGVVPAPILFSATLTGSASCSANATTSGSTLPTESGSASYTSGTGSVDTGSIGLSAPLGVLNLIEVSAMNASQSATQSNPSSRTVTATATHGAGDIKVMRQAGLTTGTIDLGAPEGLVHVTSYGATAQASASASSGSASVSTDPTKPLTIKIFDAGVPSDLTDENGSPVTCDAHSSGYCVLTPSTQSGRVVRYQKTRCVGLPPLLPCLVQVSYDVLVRVSPSVVTRGQTLPDGTTRVYVADYAPVSIVARLKAANAGSGTLVDLRTTADLGRVLSCAKFGVYPNACPGDTT